MNILCLTDAFWPDHAGGISKTVLFEVEGLLDRGHELVAVSRRLHPEAPLYERRLHYDLYRYAAPAMGSRWGLAYPLVTLAKLPYLIRKLHRKRAFDVAYVNNVFQAAALLSLDIGIPLVYVFHASAYREIEIDLRYGKYKYMAWLAWLANRGVKVLERRVLDRVDAIVVRSQFMLSELQTLYGKCDPEKVCRVPLGIDTQRFPYAEDTQLARLQLDLGTKGPILLTIRRLVARTGVESLILAMKHVVMQYPDALLLVGGRGYMEDSLRALVHTEKLENSVVMLGFIPEEMLPLYYRAADVFVLPTQSYEGFGLATLEALSCGTPVLATPVGANSEVLRPLGPDLIMEGTDVDAIGRGINQWLARSPDGEWRRRCRGYCTENFTREQICGQIESVLVDVMGRVGTL